MLVVEHRFKSLTADVAVALAVRSRRSRPCRMPTCSWRSCRRCPHAEEPAHHFLPNADFRKRPVAAWIEVDGQSLAVGVWTFARHRCVSRLKECKKAADEALDIRFLSTRQTIRHNEIVPVGQSVRELPATSVVADITRNRCSGPAQPTGGASDVGGALEPDDSRWQIGAVVP